MIAYVLTDDQDMLARSRVSAKRREVTMTTTRRRMEREGHTLAFLKALEAQDHLTRVRAEE
jgi:hypothetical protein